MIRQDEIKWIPVNERNPINHDKVIVTLEDGNVQTMYFIDDTYWRTHVIAWMPLPRAFKGGK